MSAQADDSPMLAPLRDVVPRVIQGLRFNDTSDCVHPKNTLVSRVRDARSHLDWRVDAEDEDSLLATSTRTGISVRIPRSVLRPTTRSISGMTTMEVTQDFDFIVTRRFPKDALFWDDPDPGGILKRRLPHLRSREAMLLLAGRNQVDLSAPGTSHLAVASPIPIPPTWSFWCVKVETFDEARYLAMWWNSMPSLRQLMVRRAETRGTVVSWVLRDLYPMPVLRPSALSRESKRILDRTWSDWAHVPFPSLMDQLRDRFEGRVELDRAIAEVVWPHQAIDFDVQYRQLYSRLSELQRLMSND